MARTKSSACSAMRISKTACRKKQDDRLQPGDGRFLYSWYNYTICNREIFRRYSGAAGGGGFTPHGLYPQQRASGSAVPAACRRRRDWLPMGRLGIAAVWRRRCRWAPALLGRRRRPLPTPCHGEHPSSREGLSRLRRQAAGTAENFAPACGKAEKTFTDASTEARGIRPPSPDCRQRQAMPVPG